MELSSRIYYCRLDTKQGIDKHFKLCNNKNYVEVGYGYQLVMFRKIITQCKN